MDLETNPGGLAFLAGGGEMGALMRARDWSFTPPGPPDLWPQSLCTAIRLMLTTNHPIFVFWGPQHICFYNDAYSTSLGPEKHRAMLGGRGQEMWSEIWDVIGPDIADVMAGQGATWHENHLVPIIRYGRLEEVFWTYSFSPIDDAGSPNGIGGVLVVCTETTEEVLAERWLKFRLELTERIGGLVDPKDIMTASAELLGIHLKVAQVAFAEIDAVGEVATIASDWNDGSMVSNVGRHRFAGHDGPITWLKRGETVVVTDISTDPRTCSPKALACYRGISVAAFINAPLFRSGRLVSILAVHSGAPREWSAHDLVLVHGVAERTWLAVERVRAESALLANEARQALLLRLVQSQRETGDPEAMMLAAAEAVGKHLNTHRVGFLDILDDDTLSFTVGWTDGSLELLSGSSPATGIGTAYLAVVRQGKVPDLTDVGQDRLTAGSMFAEFGARAVIDVPIIRNGRWHAGMYVNHAAVRQWTAEEAALVREIADQTWDAVERARAEAALRELNETLEARVAARTAERNRLWSMTNLLVAVAAFDSTIREVNPAWPALLGWSEAELVGRSYAEFVYPDDVERSLAWAAKLAGGERVVDLENRYRCKDGSYRWIAWAITADDSVFHCIGRDVTHQKQQADALAVAEEALRQAHKMEAVGQLTGGIAHDFNNMLQAIGSSLELMLRRVEQGRTEEAARFIDGARETVERASALTNRLLAFSRRQSLQPRSVRLDSLVEGMAELMRRTVGPAITVELRMGDGVWPVLCDPNQLESVLLNLAINARDAMAEGGADGGQLTVATQPVRLSVADVAGQDGAQPGDYAEIAVTDTGSGMDAATLGHVFEPFFTTKPIGQGTGLGLSQLYGFVRQSNGVVRIDSAPGRGTTVRLYLPRQDSMADHGEQPAATMGSAGIGAGETVLLVEDEAGVRALATEYLRELGYAVLATPDGPTALRLLRAGKRVDVLVTDVGLPGGLNGRQIADAAREYRPGLPVLFITGYAGTALHGHLAPGMEVIGKPFALDALAAKVWSMLETVRDRAAAC